MSALANMPVAELAAITGVSETSIYLELNQTGQVLGVEALRIRQRWVIPRRPIEQRLGLTDFGQSVTGTGVPAAPVARGKGVPARASQETAAGSEVASPSPAA